MEQWDAELERRVWSRVRGKPTSDREALPELIRLYRQQTQALMHRDRALSRQCAQALGLLTGLYSLTQGRELPRQPERGTGGSRDACLRRFRRMLELCVTLEEDREFGPVYTALARQLRACCAGLEQNRRR